MTRITKLALRELWNRRWSIFLYSFVALLFLLMYISIYPSVSKEASRFDELLKSYPKALLEAFNIEQLKLTTVEGYLAVEYFGFIWPLMAILLSLSLAVGGLAGEIESGTMALLLGLPLTRVKLFIAKHASVVMGLLLFVAGSIIPMWLIARVFGYGVSGRPLLDTFWLCFIFVWAITSFGMLVASFVSQKGYAYMILGGGLIVMYVLNIVAGLVDSLKLLKYASLFYYFASGNVLMGARPGWQPVAVFSLFAIIVSLLALWRFTKRDMVVQ